MAYSLDDYVDVAERIHIAKSLYPDFSLQSAIWFDVINGQQVVICKAEFYRTPDDPRPGIGHAWELIPGKTPYTKGSEPMVCETSAWGRAINAVIPVSKKIASADEVKAAKARQTPIKKAPDPVAILKAKLMQLGATDADSALKILRSFVNKPIDSLDEIDADAAVKYLGAINE